MMILAVETSTEVCSVSLQTAGSRIWEKRGEGRGIHSEKTFLFADELLDRAGISVPELDAVLFSRGPGSYTGLRIGAAAIKGMLFGYDVPLYSFPTLLSFAAGLELDQSGKTIFSVIDARRKHLYMQKVRWDGRAMTPKTDPGVIPLSEIEQELATGDILVGTGWERLSIDEGLSVQTYGKEAVSANSLIRAWNHPSMKSHFIKENPAVFEPDYLNMAQVNNSSI